MNLSSYTRSLVRSFTGLLLAVSTCTCAASGFDAAQPLGHNLFGAFPGGFYQAGTMTMPATAPIMAHHPENPKLRVAAIAEDASENQFQAGATVLVYSHDGGNNWKKVDNSFLASSFQSYSVRAITYSKKGTVVLYGDFTDGAKGGIFVSTSTDAGKSWKTPQVLATGEALLSQNSTGFSVDAGDIAFDPANGQNLYQIYSKTQNPKTYFGDLYLSSSQDLGKSWSQVKKIYSVTQDFYTRFNRLGGGQCIAPVLSFVKQDRKSAICAAFLRIYPNNSNCYSQNIADEKSGIDPSNNQCTANLDNSIFDRAVVYSLDGGKTWEEHAVLVAPLDNSRLAVAFDPSARERVGIHTFDSSLGTSLAVDEKNGILYMVWQAGHNSDTRELQEQPQIWLSFSKNMGLTWSHPEVVSQTSKAFTSKKANPNDQAFGPRLFVAEDGLIGITYYDYRHNKSGSQTIATDAWLAEFHLNQDRTAVELIRETRLTAKSFDSSPCFSAK